jgi:hypothetical protein
MPDISMCRGGDCPIQNDCYRHTATPTEYRQSYLLNPPYDPIKKKCDYFWYNNGYKENG